ncbi:MAG: hypothetical protein JWO48_1980 [Bryobacterales bacterium]|nr:hypothetical protein [Bryobacterales bacterium]
MGFRLRCAAAALAALAQCGANNAWFAKLCREAPLSRNPTPRSGLAGSGDSARSRGTALHNAQDYRRSALVLAAPTPHDRSPGEVEIRRALRAGTRAIQLPAGIVEISSELEIPAKAHDFDIRGAPSGTTLHASKNFHGRAIFTCESGTRIRFSGFTLDGNRAAIEHRSGLAPYDQPFAQFTPGNGILVVHAATLEVSNVQFVNVPGFAILISGSRDIVIDRVRIEDSGSRNAAGRNNATGGILLEEGTERFRVTRSVLRNIRGNGVWTHSLYTSPRNADGQILDNQFEQIGRDALQVGHATRVRVENNTGKLIGFPPEIVDVEGRGMPVAIDTAGNTDHSAYVHNSFEEINGKCIDLDGFHDGEVRANTCMNRYTAERYPYGITGLS